MRDKGTDPDHLGAEFVHPDDIARDTVRTLPGKPHHDPRPELVAQFFQCPEARLSFLERVIRVQARKEIRIGRFDPQQIAVGPGIFPRTIGLFIALSYGKGDGEVRLLLDRPDDLGQDFGAEMEVFPRLQDDRFVSMVSASCAVRTISPGAKRYLSRVRLSLLRPQ